MKWLVEWLHENGEKVILASLAIIALVISIFAVVTEFLHLESHLPPAALPAGILILLSTFVLFFLFGYHRSVNSMTKGIADYKMYMEKGISGIVHQVSRWEEMGIREIYISRDGAGQKRMYPSILESAISELFIVGVTLKDITNNHRSKLLNSALNGCSVRLLILTPEHWTNEHPILDPIVGGNLKNYFRIALENIRDLSIEIAKRQSNPKNKRLKNTKVISRRLKKIRYSFEVRFYNQAPTLSFILIDPNHESGRMRVEFTPHNERNTKTFRPMMDIIRTSEKGLFYQFHSNYSDLWEKSAKYLRVNGTKVERNEEIDERILELLQMPKDWLRKQYAGVVINESQQS